MNASFMVMKNFQDKMPKTVYCTLAIAIVTDKNTGTVHLLIPFIQYIYTEQH
jgi:hypothetical protein